jgi:hypothetical protein
MRLKSLLSVLFVGACSAAAQPGAPDPADWADAADIAFCRSLASGDGDFDPDSLGMFEQGRFDIDGDGVPERLEISVQGTARNDVAMAYREDDYIAADGQTFRLQSVLDSEHQVLTREEFAAKYDRNDFQFMQMSSRWVLSNERLYLLGFAGWSHGYLETVDRIDDEGIMRPICRFKPRTAVSLIPATPVDAAVCRKIDQGEAMIIPTQDIARSEPVPCRDFLAAETFVTGRSEVDFDNTGVRRATYRHSGSSTAQFGCSISYFDAGDRGEASPESNLLLDMQNVVVERFAYPHSCMDDQPRWMEVDGHTYLETRARNWRSPELERAEYYQIDTIENGKPRRVCEATYRHLQPDLVQVWRGAWDSPPDLEH